MYFGFGAFVGTDTRSRNFVSVSSRFQSVGRQFRRLGVDAARHHRHGRRNSHAAENPEEKVARFVADESPRQMGGAGPAQRRHSPPRIEIPGRSGAQVDEGLRRNGAFLLLLFPLFPLRVVILGAEEAVEDTGGPGDGYQRGSTEEKVRLSARVARAFQAILRPD